MALSFASDRVRVYLAVFYKSAAKGKPACVGGGAYFGEDNDMNEAFEISAVDKLTRNEAELVGRMMPLSYDITTTFLTWFVCRQP